MNTHLKQLWAAMKLPEKLQKSYKFFCRGLDIRVTKIMTRNCDEDVENMFRRMCFNVFAHNRDDHSKNFTYLYEADEDKWHLSPAYDLTYSNTYYGEHTTSVDGNGRNPGRKELLAVGTGAGMKKTRCEEIIDEIEKKVKEMLEEYLLGK